MADDDEGGQAAGATCTCTSTSTPSMPFREHWDAMEQLHNRLHILNNATVLLSGRRGWKLNY
ncbi:MAG: hypothetical protein ACTSU0_10025 [Alphaproteobacteria bacterium]